MTHNLLLALLLCLSMPAMAQAPAGDAAERARIAAERERAESEFTAQEKACYAKFAVNDCIEAARAHRRTMLADLRRQEVALNDAERRRRAADRVREIEAREAAQPAPPKAREQTRAQPAGRAAPAASAAAASQPAAAAKPAAAGSVQPRAPRGPADAGQNARRHQERVREAQQHKSQVQKKAADNTKVSRPLPVPP